MFRVASLGAGGVLVLCALSFMGNSAGPQTPEQLTRYWQDLAAEDAGPAYRAFWQLAKSPAAAVKLLGQHLAPAAAPDNEKIQAWLNDLQNSKFAVRAVASKELEQLGELAEPALRKVLENTPDLETRQRIELLLNKLNQPVTVPDKLRMIRAVEVLEMVGGAEAKELLQRLAKGFPGHRLTREARETLARLMQKSSVPERWLAFANGPPPAADKDDPLPFGARMRLGTTNFRHQHSGNPTRSALWLAQFTPDSRLVISNDDKAVYLWETPTGKLKRKFEIAVNRMAVAPTGTLLALALREAPQQNVAVVWWDWQNAKELGRVELPPGVTADQLSFSSNGGQLLCSSSDQSLRIWDAKTRKEIKIWQPAGMMQGLRGFSPDASHVVLDSGKDVNLLNLQDGTKQILSGVERAAQWVFSSDGKYLTMRGNSPGLGLRIWDLATGKVLWRSTATTGSFVRSVCFSPDGNIVAAGSYQEDISLWDTHTGRFLKSLPDSKERGVASISPDGRWLAVAGGVWNLETGQPVNVGDGHSSAIEHLAFSASFNLIASAESRDTVRLWDPVTGKQKQLVQSGISFLRGVSLSANGQWLAAGQPGPREGFIGLWETATGRQVYKLPGHAKREFGRSTLVHFSPDSRFLLSWGDDFYLRKWDLKTGKALLEYRTVPRGVTLPDDDEDGPAGGFPLTFDTDNAFTLPGDQFLLLSAAGEVHCFDVATGKESRVIKIGSGARFSSLAVSPTGTHAAVITTGSWTVCDLMSGKVLVNVALPGQFRNARFSPDGRTIAAGSGDKVVMVEVATGKIRLEITAPTRRLEFSPDGRCLVTAMPDTTALMWDLALLASATKK